MTGLLKLRDSLLPRRTLAVAVLVFGTLLPPMHAGELCIPLGYFNRSGGFYSYDCGTRIVDRYYVPSRCSIPLSYRDVAGSVFSAMPPVAAAKSWYAGQMPTYCDGPRVPAPPCQAQSSEVISGPEEVLPGNPEILPTH